MHDEAARVTVCAPDMIIMMSSDSRRQHDFPCNDATGFGAGGRQFDHDKFRSSSTRPQVGTVVKGRSAGGHTCTAQTRGASFICMQMRMQADTVGNCKPPAGRQVQQANCVPCSVPDIFKVQGPNHPSRTGIRRSGIQEPTLTCVDQHYATLLLSRRRMLLGTDFCVMDECIHSSDRCALEC